MGQLPSKNTENTKNNQREKNKTREEKKEAPEEQRGGKTKTTTDEEEAAIPRKSESGRGIKNSGAGKSPPPPQATTASSSSTSSSFLAKLSSRRKGRTKKGGTTTSPKEPLAAAATMNPRFPVESGESLSTATTLQLQPQRLQQQFDAPIAEQNGSAVFADQQSSMPSQNLPVWVYVIFRRSPSSGHDKVNVKDSLDGPVFWNRRVLYVFCCSCHFDRHEHDLLKLLEHNKSRVERICLVDRPLDYPFLPDSLFSFMANNLPHLEFVYLRELDLEKINRATVEALSEHRHLRKLIVHGCRNYEALQDFHNLPQLLVVKGNIQGLKAMLGCDEDQLAASSIMDESSSSVENILKA